jgi:TolB-like protein
VAVLYFGNLSGSKDDEYFRDGMTEDIITELSKIKELQVFPRAAVLSIATSR